MKTLLLLLLLLAAVPALAAPTTPPGDRGYGQNITFPDTLLVQNGGPIINVKRPPRGIRAAKGDGKTDDTDAFRDVYDFLLQQYKTHTGWGSKNTFYVYVPNGTYKVTDTLIYRGKTVGAYPKWDGTFDFNHVRWVGQDRNKAVIRLADKCPGFTDADKPKSVIAFQHPDTVFNNLPGGNYLRNLTVSTGRGNGGAVGVFMQGANQTDIRGLTVKSEDGAGVYGIWFKIGSIQGYFTDVTVQGFGVGIHAPVNAEGDPAFEYLTLRYQYDAGILHTGGGLSVRKVLSEQGREGVPAVRMEGSGAQCVVLDSLFRTRVMPNQNPSAPRANPPRASILLTKAEGQCAFVRDVTFEGYDTALHRPGDTRPDPTVFTDKAFVREWVSHSVQSLRPGQVIESLRLPIEDTPRVAWYNPATEWAVVDDYPSVQAALNSGKPVVCFKQREYKLSGDVTVPATVKFINGLGARVEGGRFRIRQASADPLLCQDSSFPIRVEARRTIIQRCAGGGLSNPQNLPVTFFLENVNDNATGDEFCPSNTRMYARQIDIEYGGGNQIVVNGGQMWVFGYKTENGAATPFTVKNGGSLEILGGYGNTTNMPTPDKQNPYIRVMDGNVSATLFMNLGSGFVKAVEETRNGTTLILSGDKLPSRGTYGTDYVIPLYVSYVKAAGVATRPQQ